MTKHTPTPWSRDTTWFVGLLEGGRPGGEVIGQCRTTTNRIAPDIANCRHLVACVNAFHSSDGREIKTEKITEGLVWKLITALKAEMATREELANWYVADPAHSPGLAAQAEMCRRKNDALLAKLEE